MFTGVAVNTSVDCRTPYRLIYRPGVGRVAAECPSSIGQVSVAKRPTSVNRRSTDRPTVGRDSIVIGNVSAVCISRQSAPPVQLCYKVRVDRYGKQLVVRIANVARIPNVGKEKRQNDKDRECPRLTSHLVN